MRGEARGRRLGAVVALAPQGAHLEGVREVGGRRARVKRRRERRKRAAALDCVCDCHYGTNAFLNWLPFPSYLCNTLQKGSSANLTQDFGRATHGQGSQ
eukprot:6198316-Pleurochrysis_carterae.AAC.1